MSIYNWNLFAADGTVLASVNNGGLGVAETHYEPTASIGGQYFVRVLGAGTNPQLYSLSITLSGIVTQTAAVTGPRLLSIAPNSGEIFNFNSLNTLNSAPTELVLRFAGGSNLDANHASWRYSRYASWQRRLFNGTGDQVIVPVTWVLATTRVLLSCDLQKLYPMICIVSKSWVKPYRPKAWSRFAIPMATS